MSALLKKINSLMLAHREDMRSVTYEDLLELNSLARDLSPIPMVLHCPACGLQHIDAPEKFKPEGKCTCAGPDQCAGCEQNKEAYQEWLTEGPWLNPPHKSHTCAGCEFQWRPADVNTEGVEAIGTRHPNDSPKRYNLHNDLAVIHSIASSHVLQVPAGSTAREALTRIRELSNRATVKPSPPATVAHHAV